jgi:Flp pilus assembly protein TadB
LINGASAAIMRPLNRRERAMNSSTLTGLAAVLFCCGIVALLAALYRDAAHGGPLLWVGLALLAATFICWFAAARAEKAGG